MGLLNKGKSVKKNRALPLFVVLLYIDPIGLLIIALVFLLGLHLLLKPALCRPNCSTAKKKKKKKTVLQEAVVDTQWITNHV